VRSKRAAYFFLIDVFIAIFIFLITLFLVNSFSVSKSSLAGGQEQLNLLADDLFTIPLSQFGALVSDSVNASYVEDPTLTIDQLIYLLYLDNETLQAADLLEGMSTWFPTNFGFSYTINDTEIYNQSTSVGIDEQESDLRLIRRKISSLQAKNGVSYPYLVSEVVVWR